MRADGGCDARALLCSPRPLDTGNSGWRMYIVAVDVYPRLRDKGHVGIAISHYGFDRGLLDSFAKKMHMRHVA